MLRRSSLLVLCVVLWLISCAMAMLKKISVIGGGLGGLAFAQGARVIGGYNVTVFERDQSPTHRSQGYQIGLNEDGSNALRKLNLPGFHELTQENPLSGFMMTDQRLNPLVRFPVQDLADMKESKMSLVNRFRLRDLLLTGLNVEWNKRFVKYDERDDCIVAHFEDGTSAESSLLVGADGLNSKVRAQYRPDIKYEKTGITSIAGFFPYSADVNNELPVLKSYVQHNLGRALMDSTNTMLFMRFIANDGQDNLLWSLSFDTVLCKEKFGELPQENSALLQELIKRVKDMGCSPELVKAMSLTPLENLLLPTETMTTDPNQRDLHVRPPSLGPTKHRVVLLGDAAHAMTTHAGRGANTAFQDALLLSHDILGDKNCALDSPTWPAFHAKYEQKMFSNGLDAVRFSLSNTKRIHAPERAVGLGIMKFMGFCVKSWNLLTKGKFGF